MTLRNRISRLEAANPPGERCPSCRDRPTWVTYRQDGPDAEPARDDPDDGEPCPGCGWRPMQLVEVIISTREEAEVALRMVNDTTREDSRP